VPAPIEENVHAACLHPDGTSSKAAKENSNHSNLDFDQNPKGLIYGTGTSTSKVRVWDLKTSSNVAAFDGHTAPVCALAFSENGYYMASASEDSTGAPSPQTKIVCTCLILAHFSASVGFEKAQVASPSNTNTAWPSNFRRV